MLVKFNASWTDTNGLSGYIFSINQTGSWVNSSFTTFGGTSNVSENITQITASPGTTVQWRFYANDTSNNWNVTDIQSFVVAYLNLTANSSFSGLTTINTGQSTNFSGNCTCFPAGQTCNNVYITIQDDRTGSFTDSTTSNSAAVYVNITSYSIGSLSGTSSDFSFNISANTAGSYQFRVQCNATNTQPAYANSTASTLTVNQAYGYLNGTLISPTGTNSQPQNQTFLLRANVTCIGQVTAICGTVNGTVRYNSTPNPDTEIQGNNIFATPFYTIELNPQTCGAMNVSSPSCNLTWTVNATGAIGSSYKLDVNFTSNNTNVASNTTNFTIINIIASTLSITISDALTDVRFGSLLNPGTLNNNATNNSISAYNITCDYPSGNCNISIKGNGNMISGSNTLGIGNVSWNQVNDPSTEKILTLNYNVINATLPHLATQDIYLWIDIPNGQVAGDYKSNFTIQGQPN